jgi:N-acetylmuramoyl-L-alanine amidase
MLLEDDYKTSYQDFDPESAESVISNSLLWSANYGSSLMFAAELDAAFRKPPFRESGYTGIHQDIFYLLWATNMPSVLLELGFISNPNDYRYLSTAEGQEKVADRLYEAFKVYKKNFDSSMSIDVSDVSTPAGSQETVVNEPVASAPDVIYGIQVMGLSRRLSSNDSALKGLEVMIVPPAAGSRIYKYVAAASDDPAAAKAKLSAVRKKFPEAFLVKVEGSSVTRIN